MPIPFSCPACGHSTVVDDQYAGQTGPCVKCGQMVTVPNAVANPFSAGSNPYAKPAGGGSSAGKVIAIVLGIVAVVLLFCGGGLVALLLPAVQSARTAARRAQGMNNLKQIGLAMHNYHDVYGTFPPAYLTDATGRPTHSWRVLILPFLDQQPLYSQYRFDEPWDGPNNRRLANMMPIAYSDPANPQSQGTGQTRYQVITGPGSAFDGAQAKRMPELMDGLANTILAVEATRTVSWMAPDDLPFEAINYALDGTGSLGNPANRGGASVLFFDGSVISLQGTDPTTLKGLITPAGGEAVSPRY